MFLAYFLILLSVTSIRHINAMHKVHNAEATQYLLTLLAPRGGGTVEKCKKAIASGADVNTKTRLPNIYGDPLCCAVAKNSPELVKTLLDLGADPNSTENGAYKQPGNYGQPAHIVSAHITPLMIAVYEPLLTIVSNVASIMPVMPIPLPFNNFGLPERPTEKSFYAKNMKNKVEIIRLLLEHGANIDAQDRQKNSALIFAARTLQPEVFAYLLERHAHVDDTRLSRFIYHWHGQIRKPDQPKGKDLYYMDSIMKTEVKKIYKTHATFIKLKTFIEECTNLPGPLSMLIYSYLSFGDTLKKSTLYAHSTKITQKNLQKPGAKQQREVKILAETQGKDLLDPQLSRTVALRDMQSAITLLNEGASVNARDKNGNTLLMHAALTGDLQLAQLVLGRKDLDLNLTDKSGHTALALAMLNNKQEIVNLILNKDDA